MAHADHKYGVPSRGLAGMSSRLGAELRELVGEFRPGYTLGEQTTRGYRILDPEGQVVRNEAGQPILLGGEGSRHFTRRVRANLVDHGVIAKPRKRREATENHEVRKVAAVILKRNPILLAQETLRDKHSTPRERSLASQNLKLIHDNTSYAALAKLLGGRLSQAEKLLDGQLGGRVKSGDSSTAA